MVQPPPRLSVLAGGLIPEDTVGGWVNLEGQPAAPGAKRRAAEPIPPALPGVKDWPSPSYATAARKNPKVEVPRNILPNTQRGPLHAIALVSLTANAEM